MGPPLWNPCLETSGSTGYGFSGQKKSSSLESLFGDVWIHRIWIRWSEKILLSGILVWRRPDPPNMDSLVRKNPPLWNPCLETTGSTEYGFAGQKKSSSLESLFGDVRIRRIWIRWSEKIPLSGILVWRRPDRPNMDSLVRKNPPLWNPCLETTGSTEYGFAGQKKSPSLESLFGDDRIDRIWILRSEKIPLSGILVWRRPDRPN